MKCLTKCLFFIALIFAGSAVQCHSASLAQRRPRSPYDPCFHHPLLRPIGPAYSLRARKFPLVRARESFLERLERPGFGRERSDVHGLGDQRAFLASGLPLGSNMKVSLDCSLCLSLTVSSFFLLPPSLVPSSHVPFPSSSCLCVDNMLKPHPPI